jgi:hypothetical protein
MNAPLPKGHPAPAMSQRERDLATIRSKFGVETALGLKLLNRVMKRYVLDLLPDAAIAELAEAHRDADDERTVRNYLGPGPEGDDR